MEVVDTFVTVAEVCGVPERGMAMKNDYMVKFNQIRDICIQDNYVANDNAPTKKRRQKPKVLLLEWIEPPYDGSVFVFFIVVTLSFLA